MNLVPLEIVTPDRTVYTGTLYQLIAKTGTGEIGILPGHSPVMGTLKPGVLKLTNNEGTFFFALTGGFLEVKPSSVTVLADAAENGEDIDVDRAELARVRAEKYLSENEADHERARRALVRAQVRLQAASAARVDGGAAGARRV